MVACCTKEEKKTNTLKLFTMLACSESLYECSKKRHSGLKSGAMMKTQYVSENEPEK